ncbi:anaerobic C4-dicarboxylate transporter [Citrobacter koseri]|uniref:C4-dicarboxylate transporter DcuA n=1 Tax=Citrobacter koseri TaxID=545 RepID=A0A2X2VQH8_CITKO|nr:anaerobic C4-dicarboxylate transporter [Citrobacter koseri]
MIVLELIIVLLAIFLGARLGGIGIGFAGGLAFWFLQPSALNQGISRSMLFPSSMAVIAAISAMQVAGGLDYLVNQTEKLLRKKPEIHHDPCTDRHLFPDYLCRYWQHLSGNPAGYR